MFRKITQTNSDNVLAFQRILLGLVFLPHGFQKMLGWFGGFGFTGTMNFFTQHEHIPYVFALLAILAEFLGSLGLIAGFLSRIAAFGIACNMVVAVLMSHLQNGFFMNWLGNQKGEGYEYHLLALALLIPVIMRGAGAFSVDRAISERESPTATRGQVKEKDRWIQPVA
jgi:putative oxidoreductase